MVWCKIDTRLWAQNGNKPLPSSSSFLSRLNAIEVCSAKRSPVYWYNDSKRMTARPAAFRRRAKNYTIVLFGNHDRIAIRRTIHGKYNNNGLQKKS